MDKSKIKKIVLAYSGGLDTSVIIPWLKEHYNDKSASDLSLVRRGGTPKIRFFPVEFPTVHLMRIER